jgi:ISXO2-like transposase domain
MCVVINYLKEKHLLKSEMLCTYCRIRMKWSPAPRLPDKYVWRCHNMACEHKNTTKSIRSESIFERSKVDLRRFIHVIYLWSIETPLNNILGLTRLTRCKAIACYTFFRLTCSFYFEKTPVSLGGQGIICSIDESCFSTRQKYHRGRVELQTWAFGIVDTSHVPARGFMTCVRRRDTTTLLPIINRMCKPGSIIHSDEWAAYKKIMKSGFIYDCKSFSKFRQPNNWSPYATY